MEDEMKLDPYLTSNTKINPSELDSNVKTKPILEETLQNYVDDLEVGKDFFRHTKH